MDGDNEGFALHCSTTVRLPRLHEIPFFVDFSIFSCAMHNGEPNTPEGGRHYPGRSAELKRNHMLKARRLCLIPKISGKKDGADPQG